MSGVRRSIRTDVDYLAPRLRKEDVEEVRAFSGEDPKMALLLGFVFGDQCWTMVDDEDTPVGMFGVARTGSPGIGAVWMLCSEDLVKHSVRFLKGCRREGWLDTLHSKYPLLTNYVDERNIVHVNWLKWMGFHFIMRHPLFGVERRPFLEFVRLQPHV